MDLELRKIIRQFIYMDNFRKEQQNDFYKFLKDHLYLFSEVRQKI